MKAIIRRKIEQAVARAAAPTPAIDLDDPKLTPEQAAEKLGIARQTLVKHFGNAPGVIRITRGRRQMLRFPASVVRRLIEAHTIR